MFIRLQGSQIVASTNGLKGQSTEFTVTSLLSHKYKLQLKLDLQTKLKLVGSYPIVNGSYHVTGKTNSPSSNWPK